MKQPEGAYATACQRSLDQLYIVAYYIKWIETSWTYSIPSKTF